MKPVIKEKKYTHNKWTASDGTLYSRDKRTGKMVRLGYYEGLRDKHVIEYGEFLKQQ